MKKFFSMMAAVVAVFTFAACGNDEVTSSSLDTPVIKSLVATAEGDGFVATWGAVSGATDYVLMIQGQAKTYSTKQTSYTVTGLTMGTYKVMVKAVKGTTESSFSAAKSVTIAGPKTVDWFSQTLALPTDDEENAAKGINSSNTILISWKGTDIDSIYTALFYADDETALDEITYDDIASQMGSADKFIDDINGSGVTVQFDDLSGATKWVVFTYVTSDTKEFFTYNTIDTNPTIPTIATQAWLGTWEIASYQQYTFATTGEAGNNLPEDVLETKTSQFMITIEPDSDYSSQVWIGGWSNVFSAEDGVYALADTRIQEDGTFALGIRNTVGVYQWESGAMALWLAYCNLVDNGESFDTFVTGDFYSTYFIMDGDEFSCTMGEGYLDQAETIPYEVLFMDVFEAVPSGESFEIGLYGDTFRYGEFDILRKVADYTPSTQALNAKKFSAPASIPTSMVVRF